MITNSKSKFVKNQKYLLKNIFKHEISIGISCCSFYNRNSIGWNYRTDELAISSYSCMFFKLDSIGTIYDLVNGLDAYCE